MKTMVEFRVAGASYCLPVEATRAVRSSVGMVTMPASRPNVAGLLPGDPPLTVMAPLGPEGKHIIVMEVANQRFGLLVDAVTGLRRVDESDIREAPSGQQSKLISGTVSIGGELVLLADPAEVAAGR
ncbi:MAG: purine-binding chemotaxis protein CheW [Nocardioidaceae bacterium]|jgi:chemotaxis signal transduction protein|nr:purine-binding chemotaxis protein CheW [Nocardioidaceae bacterium]